MDDRAADSDYQEEYRRKYSGSDHDDSSERVQLAYYARLWLPGNLRQNRAPGSLRLVQECLQQLLLFPGR